MIRYVLAVLLSVSLLAVGSSGLDHAADVRSEQQLETAIANIETEAVSLRSSDELAPREHASPRRVVQLQLPTAGATSTPVETFLIRSRPGNVSVAVYQFPGRVKKRVRIDAPIRNTAGVPVVNLSGQRGPVLVVLERKAAKNGSFVELRVAPASHR